MHAGASGPDRLDEYEARFRRAGLPLFVAGRSAATDIFNRAAPLLGLVFMGQMLGALNLEWSLAANLAALAAGLGLLLAGFAALNRSRGRPAIAIPEDVGKLELLGFVLIPSLLPLIFGGQWRSAAATALGNVVLLGLIYAVVGWGLISILRWTGRRMLGQLRASLELFARAIPLLMIFSVVLFLTVEMWEVFSDLATAPFVGLVGLFVALGASFLVARIPREVLQIEREAGTGAPPLDRGERFNVGLVMFVSQSLQVLTVSLAIGAFFAAVGLLVIDLEQTRAWTQGEPDVLVELTLFGNTAILSAELLRVAAAIAAFTGLYFAISMLTDDVYRREFLDELTTEMSSSFKTRAKYLALRAGSRP